MTDKIYVRPVTRKPAKKGEKEVLQLKVRRPDNHQHLVDEGEWVPNNRYWRRQLKDGSVEQVAPPKKPTVKESK